MASVSYDKPLSQFCNPEFCDSVPLTAKQSKYIVSKVVTQVIGSLPCVSLLLTELLHSIVRVHLLDG